MNANWPIKGRIKLFRCAPTGTRGRWRDADCGWSSLEGWRHTLQTCAVKPDGLPKSSRGLLKDIRRRRREGSINVHCGEWSHWTLSSLVKPPRKKTPSCQSAKREVQSKSIWRTKPKTWKAVTGIFSPLLGSVSEHQEVLVCFSRSGRRRGSALSF